MKSSKIVTGNGAPKLSGNHVKGYPIPVLHPVVHSNRSGYYRGNERKTRKERAEN